MRWWCLFCTRPKNTVELSAQSTIRHCPHLGHTIWTLSKSILIPSFNAAYFWLDPGLSPWSIVLEARMKNRTQSNRPQVKMASKWKSNWPHFLNDRNKICINTNWYFGLKDQCIILFLSMNGSFFGDNYIII